jgi:two-component system chemotaxis response regulator CheB
MKLLIVEDSPEIVARIRRLLESEEDIEIVGDAPSNAAAAELFARHRPEVVTLDVRLADGASMRSLRSMMAGAHRPAVIVVTDHAIDPYRQRYLAAGATHVLAKSDLASLPDLLRSIRPLA